MSVWRPGLVLFDDLRLEKAIGAGAFGEVWRAKQLSWGRDVAVKRVKAPDEARIRSMEQEAIHWLEIGLHPYVTTCYYTRRYEGAPVLVLELASEGALDRWMKDERLLFEENAAEQILKFGLEAAWGLACAHRTGLLHLDVKPANILVEGGLAKITDFGIASRLGQELTSPGTRCYAPPEQLALEDVDDRADVFSWAVTVFALFRHEVDWAVGAAAAEVLEDAWELGELPLAMPEDVYRLLIACMNEEPSARPSMEEAADDLLYIMQMEYPGYEIPSKVVERQPLTAAEYNNRAVYMHESGDLKGADEYFRVAVETAADIAISQYNKQLADYYAGRATPGKLLESILNRGTGAFDGEYYPAARVLMLNGDARSISEDPGLLAASPAASAWIAGGAPGALLIEKPHTAEFLQPDDRQKIRKILMEGGLGLWNRKTDAMPVEFIVSPKRKTLMIDNNKGAVLLGGLNSGGKPWITCMIFRERLKLKIAQFLGENVVLYFDGEFRFCDLSDPENLVFSEMADIPEMRAQGGVELLVIESLDNVSCLLFRSDRFGMVAVIFDFTHGVGGARAKFVYFQEWETSGQVAINGETTNRKVAFCSDGSVLLYARRRVYPEEWGGQRRMAGEPECVFRNASGSMSGPDAIMPSNNTSAPVARITGSFGEGATLIRHSAEYREIATTQSFEDSFEYACIWRMAPYRFLAMVFDDSPANGGSLVLEHQGEFFVARIDKTDTPPPDRVEWLMMKAVSGAAAKERRDIVENALEEYERIIVGGGYGGYGDVVPIVESLRPLLESRDEKALALWQRISRDFPRGAPFMAVECEAVRSAGEVACQVRHPTPVYPGLPFARPSTVGKIRFSYSHRPDATYATLTIANGIAPLREFPPVGRCRLVVGCEGSDDGRYQMLVYAQEGEDGKLIVGRRGILIRVFDTFAPECVLELARPGMQAPSMFVRWYGHTMMFFLVGEGLFALDFDKIRGTVVRLPQPLLPDIISLHNVAFMGEHMDELFTGDNRWRFCFDILPYPSDPLGDPRLTEIKGMLPKKPDERKAMLLRNGFGNLWAGQILREMKR